MGINKISKQSIIGFVGIGVMGASMARHILNKGYTLHTYNRSPEKAKALIKDGAIFQENLKDLAEACNIIITIVGFPSDVQEIYFADHGLLKNSKPGTVFIDMTTSAPQLAIEIDKCAKEKQMYALDAPISGGDIGAKNATLSIMIGGDKEVYDATQPLLECLGSNIVYQGDTGSGQHTKMANQIVVATNMLGVCEALIYAKKTGLNQKKVLESISKGAAGSWALSNLAPRILEENFDPGFFVKHFIKDMCMALESAKEYGFETPALKVALEQYYKLADMGFENDGTHGLYKVYNKD